MNLNRKCKHCAIELTTENAAKKNAFYFRNECKKCRSKEMMNYHTGNLKRKAYMNDYNRRIGKVKQYPCETCSVLCYKKYKKAFCSDMCRFLSYVDKTETCWLWNGGKGRKGYGKFSFRGNKTAVASRVSYELFHGPVEENMFVCHTCDVPLCVNPEHLWMGTHQENMMDMTQKGRQSSILTPKIVYQIRKLFNEGITNSELCEKFKKSSSQISNIIARRIWKHV
jgi:hypothetical protein